MTTIKEFPLGHGAMAAHQTLDLWILVRIQVPQPEMIFVSNRINNKKTDKNNIPGNELTGIDFPVARF